MNPVNDATGGGTADSKNSRKEDSEPARVDRRRFLSWITVAAGGLAALIVSIPVIGFTFAPIFRRFRETWDAVGAVEHFVVGETVAVSIPDPGARSWAGPTGTTGAWLRRVSQDEFLAFAVDCTHLGCPVRWEPGAQLFLCPCHGGVYYSDGRVAGGPPPRPLVRYSVRVRQGQVEIRTTPLPLT
jgi:menaquinol-cytochrome c reductase iron-sulfur subunit